MDEPAKNEHSDQSWVGEGKYLEFDWWMALPLDFVAAVHVLADVEWHLSGVAAASLQPFGNRPLEEAAVVAVMGLSSGHR